MNFSSILLFCKNKLLCSPRSLYNTYISKKPYDFLVWNTYIFHSDICIIMINIFLSLYLSLYTRMSLLQRVRSSNSKYFFMCACIKKNHCISNIGSHQSTNAYFIISWQRKRFRTRFEKEKRIMSRLFKVFHQNIFLPNSQLYHGIIYWLQLYIWFYTTFTIS